MARAHLFRPVTDDKGNLLYGAVVTVRSTTLNGVIAQPIYPGPISVTPLSNPYVLDNGYIDIWIEEPERVNFLIEVSGLDAISLYLDVHPPAEEVLRTAYPLKITNAPASGKILIGISETEASFQDAPSITPGVAPPHDHNGDGANSTLLGTAASADGDRSTSVGDGATADFEDATAFGYGANAGAPRATAVGSGAGANGEDSTSVGSLAQAGEAATAVGASASASGGRSVSVGKQAQASGNGAVAVGPDSTSQGENAVAIGPGAQASQDGAVAVGAGANAAHLRSTAFGPGATTSADDQVALGAAGATVVVLGDLLSQEDAKIGGAGSTVGFFGSSGSTKATVDGVVSDPIFAEVLALLDSMGLIDDQTTA